MMSNNFGNTTPYKMMKELDVPPNLNSSVPIRRTMSAADMSSPNWLHHNGFIPSSSSSSMKRAQSSEQLHALGGIYHHDTHKKQSIDDDDDDHDHDQKKGTAAFEDIWITIQSEKRSWSSILSQQKNDGSGSGSGLAPYVHPLVRRSASSLSEKSLEICTESLGSETGSDVFSYPASDPEDSDKETEAEAETEDKTQHNNKVVEEEYEVVEDMNECDHHQVVVVEEVSKYKNNKYYNLGNRPGIKTTSFPPPLPSLAHRGGDGSNRHIMRSHRHDGRLVLEAVPVPSHNCLRAHRRGGRLLLTLASNHEEEEQQQQEEEEEEEVRVSPTGLKNHVHRSSSSPKIIGLTNTRNNSTWRRNINATVISSLNHHHEEEEEAEKHVTKAAPLPPRPKMARRSPGPKAKSTATAVTALNAYEYYWRRTTAVAVLKPLAGGDIRPQAEKKNNSNSSSNSSNNKKLGVVVVKSGGVGEKEGDQNLVPFLRGCCKDQPRRRSLLFWEPYCIATS